MNNNVESIFSSSPFLFVLHLKAEVWKFFFLASTKRKKIIINVNVLKNVLHYPDSHM